MKDHKKIVVTSTVDWEGTIEELEETIDYIKTRAAELLVVPETIQIDVDYDYYDSKEYVATGWRPMTTKELETAKRQRKALLEKNRKVAAAKLAKERKEFERLSKKFGKEQ